MTGFKLEYGDAALFAGAFSVGAGKYVSMRVRREVFEKMIAAEQHEQAAVSEAEKNSR